MLKILKSYSDVFARADRDDEVAKRIWKYKGTWIIFEYNFYFDVLRQIVGETNCEDIGSLFRVITNRKPVEILLKNNV